MLVTFSVRYTINQTKKHGPKSIKVYKQPFLFKRNYLSQFNTITIPRSHDSVQLSIFSFKHFVFFQSSLFSCALIEKSQNCIEAAIAFVCTSCKRKLLFAILQLLTFVCITAFENFFRTTIVHFFCAIF